MSILIQDIHKFYGTQHVLDSVSFEIKKGEVVGLLGPNGAGKSTLMKIITCFIPPSSGNAFVNDIDVMLNPEEVKKCVGYLPEHNPLYLDMYVKEYLEFIAGIHKLGKRTKNRISEIIDLTGLGYEQHKKVGQLSKGYRQRVGLAQALIHDPGVLILDEPTSGLDPNQLVEIRNVIKEIGKQKTVMLSTHIMQEVEAICDRAIIINLGKIVADGNTSQLLSSQSGTILTVEFDVEIPADLFKKIQGIEKITRISTKTWRLQSKQEVDIRPHIHQMAIDNKLTLLSLHREEAKLEDLFRQLTKK